MVLGLMLLAGLACCASVRAAAAAASLAALWNTVALAAFCTTLLLLTPERRRPQVRRYGRRTCECARDTRRALHPAPVCPLAPWPIVWTGRHL